MLSLLKKLNSVKNVLILIIVLFAIGFGLGVYVGKKYIYKTEPIGNGIVHDTIWLKPNIQHGDVNNPIVCKELQDCYNSPFKADWKLDKHWWSQDVLNMNVHDDCKKVDIEIPLGNVMDWRIKLGIIGIATGALGYEGYQHRNFIKGLFK